MNSNAYHINIREAAQNDVEAMAHVRIATWRAAFRGLVPDDYLAGLSAEETAMRWKEMYFEKRQPGTFALVAENGSREIVAISIGGPERSQTPAYQGEIYVLFVLPAFQNLRIGRRLLAAGIQRLSERGLKTLLIWTMAGNPYRKFYENLGGRVVAKKEKQRGAIFIPEIAYGWQDIRALAFQLNKPIKV